MVGIYQQIYQRGCGGGVLHARAYLIIIARAGVGGLKSAKSLTYVRQKLSERKKIGEVEYFKRSPTRGKEKENEMPRVKTMRELTKRIEAYIRQHCNTDNMDADDITENALAIMVYLQPTLPTITWEANKGERDG